MGQGAPSFHLLCLHMRSPLEQPGTTGTGDLWNPPETESCELYEVLYRLVPLFACLPAR